MSKDLILIQITFFIYVLYSIARWARRTACKRGFARCPEYLSPQFGVIPFTWSTISVSGTVVELAPRSAIRAILVHTVLFCWHELLI